MQKEEVRQKYKINKTSSFIGGTMVKMQLTESESEKADREQAKI